MGLFDSLKNIFAAKRELYLVSDTSLATTSDRLTDVLNKAGASDVYVVAARGQQDELRIQALAWLRPGDVGYIESNGFTVKPVTQELAPNQP